MKKLKRAAIVISAICVIIFLLQSNIIGKIISKAKTEKYELLSGTTISVDEYENRLAEQDSEISGWSKLDKVKAGLNPAEDADTDGDGLTDKEEVEIYHSDPKKSSTSGDLYSDGYKVANNMDLNKKYDYSGEINFENNKIPDIIKLTATKESDLHAVAEKWTIDKLDKFDVIDNFRIYNYSGVVSLDLTSILSKNTDINASDIQYYICDWTGANMEKTKVSTGNNLVTLKTELKDGDDKVVILAKKKSTFTFGSAKDTTLSQAQISADGGIFTYSALLGFFGIKPEIYFVPSGDENLDATYKEQLIYQAAYLIDANKADGSGIQITESDIKIVDEDTLQKKHDFFAKLPLSQEVKPTENSMSPFAQYCSLNMIGGLNHEGISNDGFWITKNALPFKNFKSEYAPKGNCAGIAHLTSLLYNTGKNPKTGEYQETTVGDTYISWDLTTDWENAILMGSNWEDNSIKDKSLYTYKNRDFVKKHEDNNKMLNKNLSEGEQQFVNMIGAYWAETNDRLDASTYIKKAGSSNYDWQLIEDMMKFLNKGKILDAAFLVDGDEGHVINILDYEIDKKNPNLVKFRVYDNVFPSNLYGDTVIDNYLYVTRKTSTTDHTDTFDFYYCPYNGCEWSITSQPTMREDYAMIVYDENWNILNIENK